ncbi:MAG: radical SAM/SPASM domain-containing protein [Erysipelotrichaceae bacterium]
MRFKKIYLEITNACNMACSFCTQNKRPTRFLSKAEFAFLLQEVKPYTNYVYLHVLGEPLMHPLLPTFCEMAHEAGIAINLTVNGTLLAKRLDELATVPIRQINISLHNFQEQGVELEPYLASIMEGVTRLKGQTYLSLRLWAKQQDGLRSDAVAVLEGLRRYYAIEEETLFAKGRVTLEPNVFLHVEDVFEWPSLDAPLVKEGYCYGLKDQAAILVDGTLSACCLDGDGAIHLGNVYEQGLGPLLESERVRTMVEMFQNQKCSEALCKHCTFRLRFQKK